MPTQTFTQWLVQICFVCWSILLVWGLGLLVINHPIFAGVGARKTGLLVVVWQGPPSSSSAFTLTRAHCLHSSGLARTNSQPHFFVTWRTLVVNPRTTKAKHRKQWTRMSPKGLDNHPPQCLPSFAKNGRRTDDKLHLPESCLMWFRILVGEEDG